MIYILDRNISFTKPKIVVNGKTINNPTDKQLIDNGYTIINNNNKKKKYKDTNERIDITCQKHSDDLFIKYLIFKELGDTEQAEYFKNKWLKRRTSIKNVCKGIKLKSKNTTDTTTEISTEQTTKTTNSETSETTEN